MSHLIKITSLLCIPFISWASSEVSLEKKSALTIELAPEAAIVIDGQFLTINQAIQKALELNPDIFVEKYNIMMTDTSNEKFDSQYSPILNLGLSRSMNEYPQLLYSMNGKKVESTKIETSLAKHFSSGTTVAAGISHSDVTFDPGTTPRKFDITNPVVFLSVEQELLKNAFGYGERRQRALIKNASDAQKEARTFSMSMITLGIVADYWRLAIVSNHLDNSKLMLQETSNVKKITSRKVSMGLSEKFEINYWNSLEALSTTKLLQARQDFKDASRKFLRDINSDINIGVNEKVILTDKYPQINVSDAIETALQKRHDYKNVKRELEIAKNEAEIARNASLPSLKGFLTASSMDFNPESPSKAYSNVESYKYGAYSVGLNLSYPLNDLGNTADKRNANFKIKQAEKRIEATERLIRDDVTSKVEKIQTSYEVYQNAKNARREAEEFYKKMLTSFQNGRFNASSVRDAIDAMINAREAELQSLVGYNVALLEFAISKNELFETFKIDLEKFINHS